MSILRIEQILKYFSYLLVMKNTKTDTQIKVVMRLMLVIEKVDLTLIFYHFKNPKILTYTYFLQTYDDNCAISTMKNCIARLSIIFTMTLNQLSKK